MRTWVLSYCVSALAIAVVSGVLVVAHIILSACQGLQASSVVRLIGSATAASPSRVHVCLATDSLELRPLVAAIRSAVAWSAVPGDLVFHFVTSPETAPRAKDLVQTHLPGINVQVHHNQVTQTHVEWFLNGENKGLANAFSFVPFFFDDFLGNEGTSIDRIVYLEQDVILQADLSKLARVDLGGHASGAVRDCLVRFDEAFNFDTLQMMGFTGKFPPKACMAGRGVLVIDLKAWRQQRLTARVEEWLIRGRSPGQTPLWRGLGSHYPWMLAVGTSVRRPKGSADSETDAVGYADLGSDWECEGLSRQGMSPAEVAKLKQRGFSPNDTSGFQTSFDVDGNLEPRVVACSAKANLLHFSGEGKPWIASERRPALCAAPVSLRADSLTASPSVHMDGIRVPLVPCPELWTRYVSESVLSGEEDDDEEEGEEDEENGKEDDEEVPEEVAPLVEKATQGGIVDEHWKDTHENFLQKLRAQVEHEQQQQNEPSPSKDAKKKEEQKQQNEPSSNKDAKLKKRPKEFERRKVVGGFQVGQKVRSSADIAVRGQVVVRRGSKGVIQGPSARHPQERMNVYFKQRVDGKFRSINVLPREVVLDDT